MLPRISVPDPIFVSYLPPLETVILDIWLIHICAELSNDLLYIYPLGNIYPHPHTNTQTRTRAHTHTPVSNTHLTLPTNHRV